MLRRRLERVHQLPPETPPPELRRDGHRRDVAVPQLALALGHCGLCSDDLRGLLATHARRCPPRLFLSEFLGLLGLVLLYLAWFRQTFGFLGVAPTVDRWQSPKTSWLYVVVFGLACLVLTRIIRAVDGFDVVPEPTGLLLSLVGVLALMNGVYVWLISSGPLADEEE